MSPEVTRVVMPAGGGVAGQPVCAYLVGHRRFVLVDPGDPTGPGLDRALALAARDGGAIEAVALTHVDPDHAAGAEAVAEILGVPVFVGPGGGRPLPYEVRELARWRARARRRRPAASDHDARAEGRPHRVRRRGGPVRADRRPRRSARGALDHRTCSTRPPSTRRASGSAGWRPTRRGWAATRCESGAAGPAPG